MELASVLFFPLLKMSVSQDKDSSSPVLVVVTFSLPTVMFTGEYLPLELVPGSDLRIEVHEACKSGDVS